MVAGLPPYYFRVRDNGAFVFRVDTENRQRRIEMDQIAVVNIRNGEIKPHGGRELTPEDLAAIKQWMEERNRLLAYRDIDDIHRAVDYLNTTTQWAHPKPRMSSSKQSLTRFFSQCMTCVQPLCAKSPSTCCKTNAAH